MVWYTINAPLTAVTVTASPVAPQHTGTRITFTAVATGGTNVQYQFWLYTPSSTPAWQQLQAYSSQNTCPWKPIATGNYMCSATARDGATGIEIYNTLWYTVK